MQSGKNGKTMFTDIYRNKKIVVTGHTGFKGTWLCTWLINLGAKVVGVSRDIPTNPSMFTELGMENRIVHYFADIRDFNKVEKIIQKEQPDFVFHLAAQAIVSVSYTDPVDTISTNVIGTMNILEALRGLDKKCCAILITSDKCYDNVEWVWGYRETDALGGKDVYSGSKGAAELVIKSYFHSFFSDEESNILIGVCRAGNVIGGGDWAKDRIVVDCMRSWNKGEAVQIRSPDATRPWQHVLEPLSGYLTLGMELSVSGKQHGEAFNFGPRAEQNHTVLELLADLSRYWKFEGNSVAYKVVDNIPFHEAGLLKLNCDKALFHLGWEATLVYKDTIRFVSEWYYKFYREKHDLFELTLNQIKEYESMAEKNNLVWAE